MSRGFPLPQLRGNGSTPPANLTAAQSADKNRPFSCGSRFFKIARTDVMPRIGAPFLEPIMALPISTSYEPMNALLVDEIPSKGEWQYEPKWDGFRCLAFKEGNKLHLTSKSGQDLTRYFPE